MTSRRLFLAQAGAAACLTALRVDAQAKRKEVRVAGKRVKVVDVHAHCMFPEVAQRLPAANPPRVAPPTVVLGAERFAAMDERGIDVQALSVNFFWWYARDRAVAKDVVALHDESNVIHRWRAKLCASCAEAGAKWENDCLCLNRQCRSLKRSTRFRRKPLSS